MRRAQAGIAGDSPQNLALGVLEGAGQGNIERDRDGAQRSERIVSAGKSRVTMDGLFEQSRCPRYYDVRGTDHLNGHGLQIELVGLEIAGRWLVQVGAEKSAAFTWPSSVMRMVLTMACASSSWSANKSPSSRS